MCPDLIKERHLSYMLKGRALKGVYPYRDKHQNVLGFVVRLEDKEGHKITPTLTYQNTETVKGWRFNGFGDKRPLYGLDRLALEENKDKPVLIVEGEKTADHAQKIFNDHVVISTHGGVGGIKKTDRSPLQGRYITLWTDNDDVGITAMHQLSERLHKEHQTSSKIVDIKQYPQLSKKWDLADPPPKNMDYKDILNNTTPVHQEKTVEEGWKTESQSHAEKSPKFKYMEHDEIQKISQLLGTSVSKSYHDFELSLINVLYKSYKEMEPHADVRDLKIKAVSVGIYMSAYLTHLGFKGHFNEESFNKTYKLSLKAYYSIEKIGNFNKAFDHVHHLFGKEGNIDHALNQELHAHHQGHDNPIQEHTKHVFSHINEHGKMLEQIYVQHQHNITMSKQQDINHQHNIAKGFERGL